jgi:tetratricopeptide (TPR) repeat protein
MILRAALLVAAALALAACHRKEISSRDREEAANVLSEGEFAVTMKDWPRAEGLYVKAAALAPDLADTWMNLGIVRMRLHNPAGARSAYKSALSAYDAHLDREPGDSEAVIRKAYVLVILGRPDDARATVEKAQAKYPDDSRLRGFIENKGMDAMVADPGLKSISP